eukprot:3553604-Prymnesium_polylepis.2
MSVSTCVLDFAPPERQEHADGLEPECIRHAQHCNLALARRQYIGDARPRDDRDAPAKSAQSLRISRRDPTLS